MPSFKSKPSLRLLLVAVAIVGAAVLGVLCLRNQFHISPSQNGAHEIGSPHTEDLSAILTRLESGIAKGITPEEMQAFADQIQDQVRKHPLPDDDDTQFCAELVVRYVRELARIEAYRRATIKKSDYDPLDPKGPQSNPQAIALKNNYSTSLPARTKQLREKLSEFGHKSKPGNLQDGH